MSIVSYAPGVLVALGGIIGCALATRVPDELPGLEKPLRILQAVAGLVLLLVMPWWLALLLAGALALGGFPMLAALGVLAGAGNLAVIAIGAPLAFLAGARWQLEKRSLRTLVIALVAFTIIGIGLRAFGVLGILG